MEELGLAELEHYPKEQQDEGKISAYLTISACRYRSQSNSHRQDTVRNWRKRKENYLAGWIKQRRIP